VLSQVISDNFTDRVVLDAGLKALSGGDPDAVPAVLAKKDGEPIHFDKAGLSEEQLHAPIHGG